MTLHEAIEMILQETGRPMSSKEIAATVNKRSLYSRRDGLPVSASQITARVGNYENLFSKDLGKIKLVNDGIVSLKLQKYKKEVYNIISEARDENPKRLKDTKILTEVLKDLDEDSFMSMDSNSVQEDPFTSYEKNKASNKDKLEITYKLFHWFLKNTSRKPIVSDKLAEIFAGLDWFKTGNHNIIPHTNYNTHFLLRIAYENIQSKFNITYSQEYSNNEDISVSYENQYIKNKIEKYSEHNKSEAVSLLTTGIYIPSFNNLRKQLKEVNKFLLDTSTEDLDFLDKAIIIVPARLLSGKSKEELLFRRIITESGYLDSVIQFSTGMLEGTSISVAVLIFDLNKSNNKVFFMDASSEEDLAFKKVFNEKLALQDISRRILINDIRDNRFDLTPKKYVFDFKIGPLKKGYTLNKLKKLVLREKYDSLYYSGKKFYKGGEYKVIRMSDIDANSFYFKPTSNTLGIDHDAHPNIEKQLVSGGIALSAFNKKLKANILPEEETFLIGPHIYWIRLDNEEILDEYFIQELSKEYVLNQVRKYSRGSLNKRLYFKDYSEIQIKYPSLEEQKNLILQEMRNDPKEVDEIGLSEIDFINTLKHSLKQPASSLGSDLSSLRTFIKKKVDSREGLSMEEPVVPLFPTDTPDQIAIYTLNNTLERMHRAVTDIDYILKQARHLATAKAETVLERIDLYVFIKSFEY